MSEHKGFWFALGGFLLALGSALFWALGGRGNRTSGRISEIEADRKATEERIRREIKQSSDDELAKRFNSLAKKQDKETP